MSGCVAALGHGDARLATIRAQPGQQLASVADGWSMALAPR
jgi:hypothetical protein